MGDEGPRSAEGASGEQAVVPDLTPQGPIHYINPDIPDVDPPQYPGERYDAMVPATLDLAERSRLAVNFISRFVNPNLEYEPYNMIELMRQPVTMWHNQGDFQMQGKVLEILPIARTPCGSTENLDVDHAIMNMFLKMQGPDGLVYAPTGGRPWVLERGGYLHPPDDQKRASSRSARWVTAPRAPCRRLASTPGKMPTAPGPTPRDAWPRGSNAP